MLRVAMDKGWRTHDPWPYTPIVGTYNLIPKLHSSLSEVKVPEYPQKVA